MRNCNILIIAALFMLILVAVGCSKAVEKPAEEFQEVIDTGVLAVESTPSQADVYVNGQLKGKTPLELYNFPVGTYDVVVKRADYLDFKKTVYVRVGATEEVDAGLSPAKTEMVGGETTEEPPEEAPAPAASRINLTSFAMYHDFEKASSSEIRADKSDIFTKKYDDHINIISLTPAKIKIVDALFNAVKNIDCINTDSGVVDFYAGQTLCIITMEGNYFALSGKWDKMPSELEFVQLS
ncbi:PEGA domain-containing protein [Candidatus Woesearchaeota archaeon]|nr:PEGA domain-containing protein [Candidatus Woesearchaeota archaeon]